MRTVRAFICVELSDDARERLGAIQSDLKGEGARVAWVAPSNVHLTLAFLGDVDEGRVLEISAALDAASSVTRPFALALGAAGAFPSLARPRVFWVGLGGGVGALRDLQRRVAAELRARTIEWDEKPFSPHATLGRVKDPRDPAVARVARALDAARVAPVEFAVKDVVLMRSELLPAGARYTPLHVAPLSGRGQGPGLETRRGPGP